MNPAIAAAARTLAQLLDRESDRRERAARTKRRTAQRDAPKPRIRSRRQPHA